MGAPRESRRFGGALSAPFFIFFLAPLPLTAIFFPMNTNEVTLTLSLTEASLVLSALRDAADRINAPQLDAVIDNLNAAYINAEVNASLEEPFDGFRTDVEADADVLKSAGYGTDEDYGSEAQHDYYSPWEDDQY